LLARAIGYEAFGNLVSASGTTANDYLYSGERFDSDLGAYHLRERYYSPQRGRFLTSDPFAGFTDAPHTLHKYLYVGSDPVNYIDPSGLTETTEYHLNVVRPRLSLRILCTAAKVAAAAGPNPYLSVTADVVTLVVCGCKPTPGTSLAENKAAGDAFRDQLVDLLGKQGYDVTPEVNFPTPFGNRRFDLVVRRGGEIVYAIEAKIGNSRYRPSQRAKDFFLKRLKNVPVLLIRKGCR
jgi:RHS repeat-associated protein